MRGLVPRVHGLANALDEALLEEEAAAVLQHREVPEPPRMPCFTLFAALCWPRSNILPTDQDKTLNEDGIVWSRRKLCTPVSYASYVAYGTGEI